MAEIQTSAIRMNCPKCGHLLVIPVQFAGKRGGCKYCRHTFDVPVPSPLIAKPQESASDFEEPESMLTIELADWLVHITPKGDGNLTLHFDDAPESGKNSHIWNQSGDKRPTTDELADCVKHLVESLKDEETHDAIVNRDWEILNYTAYYFVMEKRADRLAQEVEAFIKRGNFTATEKQIDYLVSLGVPLPRLEGINKRKASALITELTRDATDC